MENEVTTLFDYLKWRGDLTLEQDRFNQIDGMILSRFSYLPFELVLEQGEYMQIAKLEEALQGVPDITEKVLYQEDLKLLSAMAQSRRFGTLSVGAFVNVFDEVSESQFSAVSMKLPDGCCLAYRGTDNTLLGWKEDLNMGFIFPYPGQEHARAYLESVAAECAGDLILCGHSKGGNVAMYAAVYASAAVQDRIRVVYDYDGPGFRRNVFEEPGYVKMRNRICTYMPQDSIVGMLLGHLEDTMVVHSVGNGPFQHNVYNWEVQGRDFVHETDVTAASHALDQALTEWFGNMDMTKRELFVEAAYSLIQETNAKTLGDLRLNLAENSKIVINSMRNMDEESRKLIGEGMSLFVKCIIRQRPRRRSGRLLDKN